MRLVSYAQPPGMQPGYPGGPEGSGYGMQPGMNGQGGNQRLQDDVLLQKIVVTLIENNSPAAWQAIQGLLTSQISGPLPATTTTQIVIRTMFEKLPANGPTIQGALTAILNGSLPLPPENKAAAFETFAGVSSAGINTLTKIRAVAPQQPQGFGYGGNDPYGSSVPGGYPGGDGYSGEEGYEPPGASGGFGNPGATPPAAAPAVKIAPVTIPAITLEPATLAMAETFLWSPETVQALVGQINGISDLNQSAALLALAAAVPVDAVRHAVSQKLKALHGSGAASLNDIKLYGTAVADPGMLAVLKTLPRTRPARGAAPTEPTDSWALATQQYVYAIRDRLRLASGSMAPAGNAIPVRLHRNATAEVSVSVTLPGEETAALGASAPGKTRIFYTRTSFAPQSPREQETVLEHYQSKTSGIAYADRKNGTMWIDGVREDEGIRRSMDVLISQAGNNAGFGGGADGYGGGGGGGNYTIEVIVVEITDPGQG
ncbi:MAG: hypothetical protein KDA85_01760 [Planctomycetaceae bacterium]|nr:hypothetical protein [Planctomycetaceae bacterium]